MIEYERSKFIHTLAQSPLDTDHRLALIIEQREQEMARRNIAVTSNLSFVCSSGEKVDGCRDCIPRYRVFDPTANVL